jgi:hypothetical protein
MNEHSLLLMAIQSPIGLVVETTDPVALKQRLYAAKRKAPGLFASLSFLTSRTNPAGEIWIANNAQATGPTDRTPTGEDDPVL